jgi:hypothetical protein
MLRFVLLLTPAFIVYSAANAQAQPVTNVTAGSPSNKEPVVPQSDSSTSSSRPAPKFKIPDGFGGLKEEEPSVLDSAPDQTGSTTARPNPLIEPTDNGQP